MKVFITGNPGVGKTTTLLYVVNELKKRNFKLSGFYCPEVRDKGRRIGFKIVDISTLTEDWLAKEGYPGNVKVGRYTVVVESVKRMAEVIRRGLDLADVIAIDEIGPMELSVPELKEIIDKVMKSDKPLVAVVHRKIRISEGKVYYLTEENRNALREEILNYVLDSLKG